MKNLSRIAMICIALLTVGTSLQSCKKGAEDPSISLKSRKARMAGEYTMTAKNSTGKYKNYTIDGSCENTYISSYTSTFQNEMEIISGNDSTMRKGCTFLNDTTYAETFKDTLYITTEVTFDKDGNYTWKTTEKEDPIKAPNIKKVITEEGTWNFVSGVGEIKNKEQILLNSTKRTVATTNIVNETKTTTTENKNSYSTIISLKSLRSDEIIMVMEESSTNASGNISSKETNEITFTEK